MNLVKKIIAIIKVTLASSKNYSEITMPFSRIVFVSEANDLQSCMYLS